MASPVMGFFAAGVTTRLRDLFSRAVSHRRSAPPPKAFVTTSRAFSPPPARSLAGMLTSAHGSFAPAIATIGSIYFVGLIILIFARETKGQALPE